MKIIFPLSYTIFLCSAAFCPSKVRPETPLQPSVIRELMKGNERYQQHHPTHPDQTKFRRQSIAAHQNPKAIVISCSDSRVPPEIIFDQGLGDLFVIRTAGNVIGDIELASIEYAVLNLKCKSILVLGHENCGAIQSFLDHPSDSLPGHLNLLVDFIRSQPIQQKLLNQDGHDNYQSVVNNVLFFAGLLKNELKGIQEKNACKELDIYAAIYHLENGKVNIIEEDVRW